MSWVLHGDSMASLALLKMFLSTLVRGCAKSPRCLCTNVHVPGTAKKRLTSPGCGNRDACSSVLVLLFLDFSTFPKENHHYSYGDGSLGTQASLPFVLSLYGFLYLRHPNNQFRSSVAWGITQRFGCSRWGCQTTVTFC